MSLTETVVHASPDSTTYRVAKAVKGIQSNSLFVYHWYHIANRMLDILKSLNLFPQMQLQPYWLHKWPVWYRKWPMWVSAWGHRSTLWALWGQLLWIQFVGLQTYGFLLFCLISSSTKCNFTVSCILDLFRLPLVYFCSLWLWPRRLSVRTVQGRWPLSLSPRLCGKSLRHVWGELLLQPLHSRLPAVSQLLQPGQRQGMRLSYESSTVCFITEETASNTSVFFLCRWTSRDRSFLNFRIWSIIWTTVRIQWVTRPLRTDLRRQRKQ